MEQLLHSTQGFWGPAFGFLGTFAVSVMGLLKYSALLKNRLQIKQANLAQSTERLRAEYNATIIAELQKAIASILPALAEHNRAIEASNHAIKVVTETVAMAQIANTESKRIISTLMKQHEDFTERMTKVQKGGDYLLSRLQNVETTVEELKSGNIFVRTKK